MDCFVLVARQVGKSTWGICHAYLGTGLIYVEGFSLMMMSKYYLGSYDFSGKAYFLFLLHVVKFWGGLALHVIMK